MTHRSDRSHRRKVAVLPSSPPLGGPPWPVWCCAVTMSGEALEAFVLPAVTVDVVTTAKKCVEACPQLLVEMVRCGQVAMDCEWGESQAARGAARVPKVNEL